MCKLHDNRKMDKCIWMLVNALNRIGILTLASCCGHGKYRMTIVANLDGVRYEFISGKIIPRKSRFYKKDKNGYYYIPEVEETTEKGKGD